MKLLLFDIDGTILTTRGVGRRAMAEALSVLWGRSITTEGIAFSGRTDPQIMRDVLVTSGVPADEIDDLLPVALDRFAEVACTIIQPENVDVLAGVAELIDHLAERDDVQLGLVTGNLKATAYRKLDAAGLAQHFPFGAFGCDHAERDHLPPVAVRRAHAHTGRSFRGREVVVIGDTEHDIRCGRGIGAFAVGVCTGR